MGKGADQDRSEEIMVKMLKSPNITWAILLAALLLWHRNGSAESMIIGFCHNLKI